MARATQADRAGRVARGGSSGPYDSLWNRPIRRNSVRGTFGRGGGKPGGCARQRLLPVCARPRFAARPSSEAGGTPAGDAFSKSKILRAEPDISKQAVVEVRDALSEAAMSCPAFQCQAKRCQSRCDRGG